MANARILDLPAINDALIDESSAVELQVPPEAVQGRSALIPELRLRLLRAAQLSAVATALDLIDGTRVPVDIPGYTVPTVRGATIGQLRTVLQRRAVTYQVRERAKVGATAGWVVAAANNVGTLATIPASQTNSTLVIPLPGLKLGDIITGFALNGSLQSGGNTASITADLRKLTNGAAGASDASVGALAAPVSVTANTVVSASNASLTGLTETVAADGVYYLLVTATTGAACTGELLSVDLYTTVV
jgi:hypothetical protein